MSELSPEARALIAQARRHGSELLGPSAQDRARLRGKLSPLWAAEEPAPAASGWPRYGSFTALVIAGLGLLGWLSTSMPSDGPSASTRAAPVVDAPAVTQETSAVSATPASEAAQPSQASSVAMPHAREAAAPSEQTGSAAQASSAAVPRASVVPTAEGSGSESNARTPALAIADARERGSRSAARSRKRRGFALQPGTVRPGKAAAPAARVQAERSEASVDPSAAPSLAGPGTAGGLDERASPGLEVRPAPKLAPRSGKAQVARTSDKPPLPSIDGELELLGAAQAALQERRPSRALNYLQEHAFRFPTGALVEERLAMQALALCAQQRRHAAQTVLSRLAALGSHSPLLPRVRSQCGL